LLLLLLLLLLFLLKLKQLFFDHGALSFGTVESISKPLTRHFALMMGFVVGLRC
jgi:hypothetical protein